MKKPNTKLIPVLAVLILIGIGFFILRPYVRFTEERPVLERTVGYNAEGFVQKANGTVTPEAEFLDTKEAGEHEFRYHVKRWIFEKDVIFRYEVIDTVPPQIRFAETTVFRDPEAEFTPEEMRANVSLDEDGKFELETDYDPYFSGSYLVKVRAEDNYGNASEDSFEVVVRDTEAPVVFRNGDGVRVLKDKEFDLAGYLSYGDNADPRPVLTVNGEVDTASPGSYPLHAKLTDSFGNRTEWDIIVNVVEEIPKSEPEDDSYPFAEFREDYAEEGRKFGLDISSWQGDIDFEAVRDAGCDFIIIRIGYSHEGNLTLDKKFRQNLDGALGAGIPIGIYLFCYDNNRKDLISSLDQVFQELGDVKLDLPVVFDWENFGEYQEYELSFQQLNRLYDVFEEEVEKRGYESMLYASKYYLEAVWTHTDTRPVWLAQYRSWPSYKGQYKIWQVSDSGVIDGISEHVDLDILFE